MAEGIIDILKSITGSQVSSKEEEKIDELMKEQTPESFPLLKGMSPITQLRRFLFKKQIEAEDEKGQDMTSDVSKDQSFLNMLMNDTEGRIDDETKDFYYKTIIPRLFKSAQTYAKNYRSV